ncbi:MAG: glycoside hydrolase family 3 protein [Tractidigestivibacter sp.]|uniref:glycoside hydrolase family 3 protein n=1 Tax=Tractidigestivibacter sp. TaxID=2847320 RepID=UPI003D8C3EBD
MTRRGFLSLGAGAGVSLLAGCSTGEQGSQQEDSGQSDSGDDAQQDVPQASQPSEEELAQQRVDEIVSGLTLEQRVAQLFFVRPESLMGVSPVTVAADTSKEAYSRYPVGGIIYFAQNLQNPDQTRALLANTTTYVTDACGLPPFLSVDEEGGTVARVAHNSSFGVQDVGNMCDVGATGDAQNAYTACNYIGSYLVDLGFNTDFAPDCDVCYNPSATVMAKRSFGSDPELVASMVEQAVRGFADAGIFCTAKHFPGIGAATGDFETEPISLDKTVDELAEAELVPFKAAIDAGAAMVMVGHLGCPGVSGDDTPASICSDVVQGILRDRLGFTGVAITDSCGMGAITSFGDAGEIAVRAIQAGEDMVLGPADFTQAYNAVLDAVSAGTITDDRIDESIRRIVAAKLPLVG